MKHRHVISLVIYFFFTVGILALTRTVILEIKTGNICPRVLGIPMCFPILTCFIIALITHITSRATYLYFVCIGFSFTVALTASILHIAGYFTCPLTILKGVPKCFYAVGLLSGLLILKTIQYKEIEKGPV
ncbi:hypothetical protein [Tenacibaculum sp. 190524A05c]|uniref:hypothetical protein n=1 Tax=Tenacibaculum platacis TaxID=3137852 RepID=UPI0032B25857